MQIQGISHILTERSTNIFNNNYSKNKQDKSITKFRKQNKNINNVSTEDSDRQEYEHQDFKLPNLTGRHFQNTNWAKDDKNDFPQVEKYSRAFSSPSGSNAYTSKRWAKYTNQNNYEYPNMTNNQFNQYSGHLPNNFETDDQLERNTYTIKLHKDKYRHKPIKDLKDQTINHNQIDNTINNNYNLNLNLNNKSGQSFGLEGNVIKSFRQDYMEKEKERIDKEKAKINQIFNNQKLNRAAFKMMSINSSSNVLDNYPKNTLKPNNNVGVSFNDHMVTINENTKEETDDYKDDYLYTQRKPQRSNSTRKLSLIKSLKKKEDLKIQEQKELERKNLDKAMRYRFYIEDMNGFYQLFRSKIKMNSSDWNECDKMNFLLCNYVHHQKNMFDKSLIWLPKNEDDKMIFYKEKQKRILEYIERNPNNTLMKKLEKIYSIELTSDNESSQLPYYYSIFSHLENNDQICSKEGLHKNLRSYYLENNLDIKTSLLPLTYHINHKDLNENEWNQFKEYASSIKEKVWIVKPGVDSNKGYGIQVFDNLEEIYNYTLKEDYPKWVVQKYIEKPLLIKGRKFDIRIYGLVTSLHGVMKAYFFKYAYIRTNSAEYSLKDLKDPLVHLSNDAIQAKDKENYGKFEDHNKMSVAEFTREYLYPRTKNYNYFYEILWPKMRDEFQKLLMQTKHTLDPNRRHHGFEVLGFDFMLDNNLNLYIIEVNSNPALGTFGCKVLENAIFPMSNDTFNLSVNKLYHGYQDNEKTNKNYEIVYDDLKDL